MAEEGVAELGDILDSLASIEVEPSKFADALHEKLPALGQELFNRGHNAATAKFDSVKGKLEQQIQGFEKQVADRDAQLKELSAKEPDKDKYLTQIRSLQEQLEQSATEAESKINAIKETARQRELQYFNQKAIAKAHELYGVPLEYAEAMTMLPKYAERFERNDDGTPASILDDNGVPMHRPQNQDLASMAAKVLQSLTPSELLRETRQTGGEIGSTNNGSGKRIWKSSEIKALQKDLPRFQQYEAEIDLAAAEGRIVRDT